MLVVAACADDDDDVAEEPEETPDEEPEDDEPAEADLEEEDIDESAFYYDKEIEIIVPFSTGGGTDTQARFMAPFLPNHIPGAPSIGVFNIAGAGGTVGNNQFALERDHEEATSVLFSSASSFFPWLFEEQALELDYTELVGTVAIQTGGIVYVSPDTGIESPEDFIDMVGEVDWVAAEQTPDSLGLLNILAYDMLDMDAQVVMGIEGRGPGRVLFEQGEININWDTTASVPANVDPLIEDGSAVPVFTIGQMEDGELVEDAVFSEEPYNLPTFAEVYEEIHGESPEVEGDLWESYKTLTLSGYTLQKVMWLHQDAPDEAVADLREGFASMTEDPEFQEQALEIIGDYELVTGDAVDGAVADLLDLDPALQEFMLDYIVENYDHPDPR